MAAQVGIVGGSPIPIVPVALDPRYTSKRIGSISGTSIEPAILYCSRLALTIFPYR
jgi:hypothetical protein